MPVSEVTEASKRCLCQYRNLEKSVRVVRAASDKDYYIERSVFPQQYFVFWANRDTTLEVYSSLSAHLLLEDRISCDRLEVGAGDRDVF
jgi:Domain of unknown function (DUF1830)